MQTQIFKRTVLGLMTLGLTLSMLAIFGCGGGGDNNETSLRAALTGAGERPLSVATSANGTAQLTINDDETEIQYVLTYNGLTNVTQAHIHVGSADVAGPIILFYCTNVGLGANVPCSGAGPIPNPQACPQGSTVTISGTLKAADLSCKAATATTPAVLSFADAIAQIKANNTYSNVHTQTNPGGEIRAQNLPPT